MFNLAIQIDHLKSRNKNKRYKACEELRSAPYLSLEAITALQQAKYDSDPRVAEAAGRALLAHSQVGAAPDMFPTPISDTGEERGVSKKIDPAPEQGIAQMYKSIRGWAFFFLLLGVISLFSFGGLDPIWGVVLIIIAILGSLPFRCC